MSVAAKPNFHALQPSGFGSIVERDGEFEQDPLETFDLDRKYPIHSLIRIVHTSKISNHYEVPNMASMLYEFTNREANTIH